MGASSASFQAHGAGKVILLGEHGVVYGHAALAGPVTAGVTARGTPAKRCALEMPSAVQGARRALLSRAFRRAADRAGNPPVRVSLESNLPLAMGLGSSAALSVACARVLLQAAGKAPKAADVFDLSLEMESEFHGTPSGVDHATSIAERLILFRRGKRQGQVHTRAVRAPIPLRLLVVLVGERTAARDTIRALRERSARWPRRYERLFEQMGVLAQEGARAVAAGDLDALGDLMNVNQGLLGALQLSSSRIDEMVYRLRRMGALGAKLTGAGGDGGAVIGLFPEPAPALAQLRRAGVSCFATQVAGPRAL